MPASHRGIAVDCYKLLSLDQRKRSFLGPEKSKKHKKIFRGKKELWKKEITKVKIHALRGSQVRILVRAFLFPFNYLNLTIEMGINEVYFNLSILNLIIEDI